MLVGGGALLPRFDRLLQLQAGLTVTVADDRAAPSRTEPVALSSSSNAGPRWLDGGASEVRRLALATFRNGRGGNRPTMAGVLFLRGGGSSGPDLRQLTEDEERVLTDASQQLVAFTAPVLSAAIVHAMECGRSVGWNVDGALRLARSLPPAFADLAREIAERQRSILADAC